MARKSAERVCEEMEKKGEEKERKKTKSSIIGRYGETGKSGGGRWVEQLGYN